MKELEFDDKLTVRICGLPQRIKMDIGALREMGIKEFDGLKEYVSSAAGLFEALLCVLNRAVKKYNKEYNAAVEPFTYNDVIKILPDTAAMKRAEVCLKVLNFTALPKKKDEVGVWHEDSEGRQIEPNADRLYVMALTVLNLGADEALSMTAAEISELLGEYGYINNTKENPRELCRGKDVEGIGSGDELARRMDIKLP